MAEPIIVSPQGGMNQDDSMVTPAKDAAGKSLFSVGDYRYALNGRIGSSRVDHFGDFENIRGTKEVTRFYSRAQIFQNNTFQGSISPWSQIDVGVGGPWVWQSGTPSFVLIRPGVKDIIYQGGFTFVDPHITVSYKYRILSNQVTNLSVVLVFLQGTTILNTQIIDTRTNPDIEKLISGTIDVTIPSNCNGIGLYVDGTPSIISNFALFEFSVYSWFLTSRPDGDEKVVGRYEDYEFLKLYYCVYNSLGYHSIRYWDKVSDSIFELLNWGGLNFRSDTFVKMTKLDNWMTLVERNNDPRLIDVDKISNLYFDLGNNFREFHISLHKWSPTAPPIPRVWYDNVTNNYNRLKNKIFQFSYRYIYKGNLKSRWSPISKGAITTWCGNYFGSGGSNPGARIITSIEVDIPGCILDQPNENVSYNYFDHTDPKFTAAVESIELAYRGGKDDLWKLWKTVSMDLFSRFQYFTGDADQTPVNIEDFNQPFDTVPIRAGSVESIDNRLVLADILDENTPVINLAVGNVSFVTDPGGGDWNDSFSNSFPQFSFPVRERLARLNSLSDFSFKYRGTIKVGIQFLSKTGWRSGIYTDSAWSYTISFNNSASIASARIVAFTFNFPSSFIPPDWAVGYQIMRTNTLNISEFVYGAADKFVPLIDAGIPDVGLTQAGADIRNAVNAYFDNAKIVAGQLDATIIDYSVKLQAFLQENSVAGTIRPEVRNTVAASVIDNASRLYIQINNWYNAAKETANRDYPMNKLFVNVKQGDRVRFLGSPVANPVTIDDCQIYDVLILEWTGIALIVEKPGGLQWIPGQTNVNFNHYTIEVYTPKNPVETDHIFYETGEWYPVLFPGTTKRDFSKRDWVYTSNAAVTLVECGPFEVFQKMPFFYGDVSHISKTVYRPALGFGPQNSVAYDSMTPDLDATYGSWDHINGRPALAYKDLPVSKFKPTTVRFGGKIVEQSSINNLNKFREEDQFVYPSEYGRIRGLVNISNAQVESVGSILLAIGERETWSIYVNRTTLEDLGGRTQVTLSDRVLGSFNTLLGSRGTMNPESISRYRGRVYWWDVLNGVWCRYGRDGLTDISEYKMRNWFRELSDLTIDSYQAETGSITDIVVTNLAYYGNASSGVDWTLGDIPTTTANNNRSKLLFLNFNFKNGVRYTLIADYQYGGPSSANRISLGAYKSGDIGFAEQVDNVGANNGSGTITLAFDGAEEAIRLGFLIYADAGSKTFNITRLIIRQEYAGVVPAKAVSGFDAFNDELVTFIDHISMPAEFRGYSNYKGALFSEADVRWKSCHNLTPELIGRMNNKLILFKDGRAYIFEGDDQTYSTFFGQKYDVMYEPVFTAMVQTINYNALGVLSTDAWSVQRILSEYRGAKPKQETRIPLESFKNKEGTYWAAMNRNVNSIGGVINGQQMKSRAIQVLMKLDPSVSILSLLHYVAIEQQDSPKNP